MEHTKLLIIGSGPAGYTAAIYACRANLSPILLEGALPGGQLTQTTEVDNFPGYPEGVQGFDLMEDLRNQALRFGCDMRPDVATALDATARPFTVTLEGGEQLSAEAVVIATGARPRYLGLEGERQFAGKGVSACATCDGFFYRGKTVAVVGGGDTACEEASYLAGLAQKVYLVVRKPYLRASKAMQERVTKHPKIEILYEHNTVSLNGAERLQSATLRKADGTLCDIAIDGFFLAIGHEPNSALVASAAELTPEGYIAVDGASQRTSVPGLFAAGDVCDPTYRQAIIAAGYGAKAAMDAERFLAE